MKILFLGEIGEGQTSLMRLRALLRLGYEVHGINTSDPWKRTPWLQRQVQRWLAAGSVVRHINESVLRAARDFKPDLVWAEKQEYLRPETVLALRQGGARLVHFTPDPYFSLSWKRTPLMDRAISEFDVLVYCKIYESDNFRATGKATFYMPLGYCDEAHRPLASEETCWRCAVGFVGGWEPRRERLLSAIAASGTGLKIRGNCWDFLRDGRWTQRRHVILKRLAGDECFSFHRNEVIARVWHGGEVYGDDYARALTGATIGLGLLRKVWPDQHTTRTFEIPACGSMLLADRTEEHQAFFEEGREAEFFSSMDELLDKIRFYTQRHGARLRIAGAGLQRCINGRYAYIDRLRDALNTIRAL
jgi:spore maturation protein CgeB